MQLLTSPIGGADAVALRRLRRALRAEERAGGGGRASGDLLVEAVLGLDRVATLPSQVSLPARRVARVLAAGRRPPPARSARTAPRSSPRASTPRPCCGRSGTRPGWPSPGGGRRWPAARRVRGPTVTWTPSWRCSTRRPASSTGCRRPARPSSSSTCAARRCPATPWSSARRPTTPCRCSPRRVRPAASGGWSSSPGSRWASGRTPGCGARCSARRPSSTSWPAAVTARPRHCGRPRPRCGTRSSGCSTSPSAGRARCCSSPPSRVTTSSPAVWSTWLRRWKPLPHRAIRSTKTTSGSSRPCPGRCPCRPSSPGCDRWWPATTPTPPTPRPGWPDWWPRRCPAPTRTTGTAWRRCPTTPRSCRTAPRSRSRRQRWRASSSAGCAGSWRPPAAGSRQRWPRTSAT